MPVFGLMPWRVIGIVVLVGSSAAMAWNFQDWRYGRQLAEQARSNSETLNQLTQANAIQQRLEHDKRLILERQLSASEQNHYRVLSDAQRNQARLRDRLATADVRLSVLLDATDTPSIGSVPAAPGPGGMVHGAIRARLDPAHAQRIIAITDIGDRGLIALQACQAYIRTLTR
ncbi:lysis system i-spanin subunit Rz [Pseudomonas sp. Sample_24]|uniref:lysis system i-spanin subunit Rz n=1 Tax=Pseudomonas sp. Sample_24 TaxID=2448268 RepID=UPI001032E298|nr:lysis system i-spanin subunit Rz [Pseudomonas sp. Sample_24]